MRIDFSDEVKNNPLLPNEAAFQNASRPPNQLERPPSDEELLMHWEQEHYPLPFKDEDGLPYMTFAKNGMHAILHRKPEETSYHVFLIYHEAKGAMFICNCINDVDANRIFWVCGMAAFAPLLFPEMFPETYFEPS